MKHLYLECHMGAAGDMLMAALLELLPEKEGFLRQMNSLGLPGIRVECVPAEKCGIQGSHIRVTVDGREEISADVHHHHHHEHDHGHHHKHNHTESHDHTQSHGDNHTESHTHSHPHDPSHTHAHMEMPSIVPEHNGGHHHYGYAEICGLIERLPLPAQVRTDAAAVYKLIGDAESHAHGAPLEQIHFHEVGALDAVADVVGCCLLMHLLHLDKITVSPVHVGSGAVRCAHGILPVPAPATAHILMGVPTYGGSIQGELCTPTGAALLRHFAAAFGDMPLMAVERIGYGMGSKDFPAANCLRAFLGTDSANSGDEVAQLSCNLDDMTPEAVGFAVDILLAEGALDVCTAPIYMKKNRPGILLTCLCKPEQRDAITRLMLLHTTTMGVRGHLCRREVLDTAFRTVDTPYGEIRMKSGSGVGISKEKPEYEDVKAAALAHGTTFGAVYDAAKGAT